MTLWKQVYDEEPWTWGSGWRQVVGRVDGLQAASRQWSGSLDLLPALSPPLPQPHFPHLHLHNEGLLSQLWRSLRPGLRVLEGGRACCLQVVWVLTWGHWPGSGKRQTLPMVPFCSKSDLKNLAVSMFTWKHSREGWRQGQAPSHLFQ